LILVLSALLAASCTAGSERKQPVTNSHLSMIQISNAADETDIRAVRQQTIDG
jgi:hypothetical protein